MKFESYTETLEPENRFEDETGSQFEEHMLPPVDSNWNGKKWRENTLERESVFFLWVKDNVLSKMSEDEKRQTLEIPKTSLRNPRRNGELNDLRMASAWNRLSREKRRDLILKWSEEHQPENWDPTNPVRKTESGTIMNLDMANFHHHVVKAMEELGVIDEAHESDVRLFSALHTPVDDMNGVDAFYDFRGILITLDLTKNKDKSEAGVGQEKADVIITDSDFGSEGEMDRVSQNIARAFKDRLEKQSAEKLKKAA